MEHDGRCQDGSWMKYSRRDARSYHFYFKHLMIIYRERSRKGSESIGLTLRQEIQQHNTPMNPSLPQNTEPPLFPPHQGHHTGGGGIARLSISSSVSHVHHHSANPRACSPTVFFVFSAAASSSGPLGLLSRPSNFSASDLSLLWESLGAAPSALPLPGTDVPWLGFCSSGRGDWRPLVEADDMALWSGRVGTVVVWLVDEDCEE